MLDVVKCPFRSILPPEFFKLVDYYRRQKKLCSGVKPSFQEVRVTDNMTSLPLANAAMWNERCCAGSSCSSSSPLEEQVSRSASLLLIQARHCALLTSVTCHHKWRHVPTRRRVTLFTSSWWGSLQEVFTTFCLNKNGQILRGPFVSPAALQLSQKICLQTNRLFLFISCVQLQSQFVWKACIIMCPKDKQIIENIQRQGTSLEVMFRHFLKHRI